MSQKIPAEYAKTRPLAGSSLLVIKEIQSTIQVGMAQLDKVLINAADDEILLSASRKKVITYFYQSASALNWIGLDGITALLELMQSAVIALADKQSAQTTELQAALHRSSYALTRHLNKLSFGYQIPTTRLFPCYRDLYALLNKANAQPAVLLSLFIADSNFSGFSFDNKNYLSEINAEKYNPRAQFEQALLIFLRTTEMHERQAAAEKMSRIICRITQKQTVQSQQYHWQVLFIFSDCVVAQRIAEIGSAKKIFAAISRQMRHLDDPHPPLLPPQLIREVLFEIAQIKSPTIIENQISSVFRLAFQLPVDYQVDLYTTSDGNHTVANIMGEFLAILARIKKAHDENIHVASLQVALAPLVKLLAIASVDIFTPFAFGLQKLGIQLAEEKISQQNLINLTAWMLLVEQGLANDLAALDWLEQEKAMLVAVLDEIADGLSATRVQQVLCQANMLLEQPATNGALVAAALQLLGVSERKIEEAMQSAQCVEIFSSVDNFMAMLAGVFDLVGAVSVKKDIQQMRAALNELAISTNEINNHRQYDDIALQFLMLTEKIEKLQLHEVKIFSSSFEYTTQQALPDTTVSDFSPSPALHAIYLNESQQLVKQLAKLIQQWLSVPDQTLPWAAVHAAHSLAGSSGTVGLKSVQELAAAMENILQLISNAGADVPDLKYQVLYDTTLIIMQMLDMLDSGRVPEAQTEYLDSLTVLVHQLQYPLQGVEIAQPAQSAQALVASQALQILQDPQEPQDPQELQNPHEPKVPQGPELPQPSESNMSESSAGSPVLPALLAPSMVIHPELRALFMLEVEDLLPHLSQQMRALREEPDKAAPVSALLRILHTLKGSARMAGAETLGQQLHEMEFAVDQFSHCDDDQPLALQKLLAQLDHVIDLVAMLDEEIRPLLTPVTEPSLIPVTDKITATSIQLRVRADLLERISSSAAELTVGGARVANEFQLQRQAISDLTDNINRLRSQLRELEIQAETRITSQLQINNSREFDPLEFDHFTGLQELTRMMAESLGDIISVQRTLARHVDDAGLAISAQSRYARNLQTDLRRVRIVLFSSIAERLHHLVRQVGRELDKEVQLDITGGNIELDRSMLEKMGAPLEHLLRNAIAHGIESSEMRAQAGKPVIGSIKIILAQQANDVIIQVSDDGQGLDLERIREKAIAVGLLQADYSASEAELAALIFEAGLSTADEVTAIAGRGIGMDVVRATVLAQGGSIDVATQSGMGITFKIVLPLIQATTQVVLVHAGLQQMAIPSAMVEQVLQLPAARARIARQAAVIESRGKQLPLYHLSLLLGMSPATIHADTVEPPAQIIILRGLNGSFAIELDAIHGNREVVVKNIGPQLAHVIGIAGATVLADGSVVLIINPVALIESVLRTQRSGRPHNHDSVALHSTHAAIPLVLVVDDSLTVRRVSQRMLERCGYAVALARDGLDALEKLQTISPSVVLLDIEMPRMDGFELLRKLRQEPPTRELPVVMITSRSADKHREHALKLGATAYLGKPFNETELLALLKQLCAEDSLPAEQLDMA